MNSNRTLRVSDADRDVLVALALTVTTLIAGGAEGWHHPWPFGWALWWIVPVMMTMRLASSGRRRIGGARPWR